MRRRRLRRIIDHPREKTSLYLDPEIMDQARILAAMDKWCMSKLIEELLRAFCDGRITLATLAEDGE